MKRIALAQADSDNLAFTQVNDEDYEALDLMATTSWRVHNGYAAFQEATTRKMMLMHRIIMGVTDPNIFVDHINGDRLDNVRTNLRICTPRENSLNRAPATRIRSRKSHRRRKPTSAYRGVTKQASGKFKAQVCVHGDIRYLGLYVLELEAALRYDVAARLEFGEFARLNFATDEARQQVVAQLRERITDA